MNDRNRNNNEVEYCSKGYIIVLRPNTNSRKIPGFHRGGGGGRGPITRYYHRPIMCHNYILRIYLKIYSKIIPTL